MTTTLTFDTLIIGSGPGGTACAKYLASHGNKVALISKELGGECLNYGCIPTKTLLWTTELLERINEGGATLGIDVQNVSVNWPHMQKRRGDVINKLKKQLAFSVQQSGAIIIEGVATFVDAHTVEVSPINGGEKQIISAKNIVIATGSTPRKLAGFEWSEKIISNKEILEMPALPSSLLIIGGGVVGVEFASLFAGLGVAVTLAEAGAQLLPLADKDVAQELERIFTRKKITILKDAKISLDDAQKFDKVLVAVGRKAATESLNLTAAGVMTDTSGIAIDELGKTNVPHIFAVGDCTNGKWKLAYTAEKEGVIVAESILGMNPIPLNKYSVPITIFSLPEIGSVGDAENGANGELLIGKSAYSGNAKALIMAGRDGFAKVIADKQTRKIRGVHLIGERAADLIAESALAVANELTLEDFALSLRSHPVLSEILKEAIENCK